MTKVWKYLLRSLLFLAVIAFVVYFLNNKLLGAFFANPALNGVILTVFIVGVLGNFLSINMLNPEIKWLNDFLSKHPKFADKKNPKLLSPVARMLREHQKNSKPYLSTTSMNSLLDIVGSRLDVYREKMQYFTGILIFLGLLGTFWGLLISVSSIHDIIKNLNTGSGDDLDLLLAFESLKQDLTQPLKGMGTAFSSSLLGLSGSLILGYLNTELNNAQNHFYTQIEDKLSGLTRIAGSLNDIKTGNDDPYNPQIFNYLQALLEQNSEAMNRLERIVERSEESNTKSIENIELLANKLTDISEQTEKKIELMEKTVKNYNELAPVLETISKEASKGIGLDKTTKENIKNILKTAKEMKDSFSNEIKILSKSLNINKK